MTAATSVVKDLTFTPGIHFGSLVAANDYTTTFGFASVNKAIVMSSSDDDAIATVSVSAGSGTIGLIDDAGAAVTSTATLFYIAWGKN